MSSTDYQQHTFPAAPPSLSAGDHEMRDYYVAQDAPRPNINQEPYLTPYLGLRARLSQTWINKWSILLLLVLVRMLIACASLNSGLASAQREALSACTGVEGVGSALASMPHYMSQGVNVLAADGIDKAVNGLMSMLLMTVTGVEEMVVFIINLLTQTYLCLLTFAIGGSLHVAIGVAEDVSTFLNSTLKDIGHDIENGIADFETALDKFINALNKVGSVFGSHSSIPTLDVNSSISALNNLQLPSGLDEGLTKLNNSIPTFADVNNFTNNAIKFPFEEVKKLINDSLPTYSTNHSLFPVPDKQSLSFCGPNSGINAFFVGLIEIERLARKIFMVILIILAILASIPMAYRELRRWRTQRRRARLIIREPRDPMDVIYICSRPYTAEAGIRIADRFSSDRIKILIRWAIAYATTLPALFVLSLGIAGLFSSLCQYILLSSIVKEVPKLEHELGGFADSVVNSLDLASQQWATGANGIINDTSNMINHDVFGWVNTSTTAVNNTLNVFVDDTMKVLNETFGGTILYTPILDVLDCLVLLKIQGIEKGLTWVQDHAYIELPMFPNNTFSVGALAETSNNGTPSSTESLLTPGNSDASSAVTEALTYLINSMLNSLRTESIISSVLVGMWVVIVLIGVIRCLLVLLFPSFFEKHLTYSEHSYEESTPREPAVKEGSDVDSFLAPAPVMHERPSISAPPYEAHDNTANKFHGTSYTLSPRPFPQPGDVPPNLNNLAVPQSDFGDIKAGQVKSGQATTRPAPPRQSSHVDLATATPYLGEKSPVDDPFADPR
ncbi:MAG: plasma membrane fusion protein prm1 [Bathelium mastoideum]|nr:MAG: plasma membrane fusion protein prm1 [Bathelium mastoideum]